MSTPRPSLKSMAPAGVSILLRLPRNVKKPGGCSALAKSGDWLWAVPSKDLGLSLSAAEFRVALCFRLNIPLLSEESSCPKFSKSLDVFSDHALGCSSSGDRIHRDNRFPDTIYNLASKVALSPVLEKSHLTESRSRPGDFFYLAGLVVVPPLWMSPLKVHFSLPPSGTSAGYALEISDDRKIAKHASACNEVDVPFIPLSAEALGGWSTLATKNLCRVVSMADFRSGNRDPRLAATYLLQQLSAILQKGNATLLLARYWC